LGKRLSLRRQKNALRSRLAVRLCLGVERLHACDEDVDVHHHAAAAAVRRVVDAAMLPEAVLTRTPDPDSELSALHRAANQARREKRLEELGKERDDVDAHEALLLRRLGRAS